MPGWREYNLQMSPRLRFALLFALLLALPAAGQNPPEEPPETTFGDEITVALESMIVRVVDNAGRPVLGLKPEDFRVLVGKREVPVAGLDWISYDSAVPAPEAPAQRVWTFGEEEAPPPQPAGRLLVFFVQADLNPTRISGQLRLRPYTRELLATLQPGDRAAVVSFDSHLKLWLDFSSDPAAIHAAIDRAMLFGGEPERPDDTGPLSLARSFDFAEALDVASPERALEVTARALEPLPGEKVMIYLGWGIGRFSSFGVQMTPDYKPAVRALGAARVTVFVLDVTSADYHSLEVGLQAVAEATGGTYAKTHELTGLATRALARTISGHYVLTLDADALPARGGKVRVELRNRQGIVLVRPVSVR
jgi:VWFA-related protein